MGRFPDLSVFFRVGCTTSRENENIGPTVAPRSQFPPSNVLTNFQISRRPCSDVEMLMNYRLDPDNKIYLPYPQFPSLVKP
jgi:hypothetical protein